MKEAAEGLSEALWPLIVQLLILAAIGAAFYFVVRKWFDTIGSSISSIKDSVAGLSPGEFFSNVFSNPAGAYITREQQAAMAAANLAAKKAGDASY